MGGLGDVAFELPQVLNKTKKVVSSVIVPLNKLAIENLEKLNLKIQYMKEMYIPLDLRCHRLSLSKLLWDKNVEIFLVGGDIIEKSPPYPEKNDPLYNFVFPLFALGCLEILKENFLEQSYDLIHVHDWPASLIPIFSSFHRYYKDFKIPPIVLSIHNIAHQGIYEPEVIEKWHLLPHCFNVSYLEFWGKINLLKGGIILSRAIITVSPSYAEEIKTPEFGFGLDGVIRENAQKLYGITNGIDQERWDPSKDNAIPCKYDYQNLEGKRKCKANLLKELSLENDIDKPLISVISRITYQKGFDILIPVISEILNLGCQMIVLGSGDPYFSEKLSFIERDFSSCYKFINTFDETLARKVYAASDILLMPSLYEPCGISQMIALRYGTIPVARKVGGLKDTIKDLEEDGWGFLFEEYSPRALLESVRKAISIYTNQKEKFSNAIKKAMCLDFSWESKINSYLDVYKKILKR